MTDYRPTVSAVVLNWNEFAMTKRCVESVLQVDYPDFEVLVVDNGSSDNSGERLDERFSDVEVVYNEENLGFAGGMNAGIERSVKRGADYTWVLNNDVLIPDDDLLGRLVARLEANPSLGALTPKVMHYPETQEAWFLQGTVDWKSGNSYHHGKVADPSRRADDIVYSDYVPFCSVLFRTDVFDEVGLFPTSYFLYLEDVEFCGRLAEAGYSVGTDLFLESYHEVSTTSGGSLSPTSVFYAARNRWLLKERMNERTNTSSFLVSYLRWSAEQLIRVLWAEEPKSVLAWARGTIEGIRGTSGRGPYP